MSILAAYLLASILIITLIASSCWTLSNQRERDEQVRRLKIQ